MPTVPTVREQGFEDADAVSWFSIVVPSTTPPAVIERLSQTFGRITTDPEVVSKMKLLGIDPLTMDSATVVKFVNEERRRWIPFLRETGIKAN